MNKSDLPKELGKRFKLEEGHRVHGHYARNGYPDYDDRLLPNGEYEVDAQWMDQLMVAVVEGNDFHSTKHRYVIVLD